MRLTAIPPLVLVWAASAGAEPPAPPCHDARLDARSDEVVARSYVPSEARRVGEVRLIRRSDANVVQTLLYTKVLSRVVGEIRKKELANWPDGPGRADALRYVGALEAVRERVFRELSKREPKSDRRQKVWIEFLVAPRTALVAIGRFEMETRDGEVRVVEREPIVVLEPSREYVVRNMRLIAADSFRVEGEALRALLAPLEWLRSERPSEAPGSLRPPGFSKLASSATLAPCAPGRDRMAKVDFTPNLRRHLAVSAVEVPGGTLRSVLDRVFGTQEKLRGYVLDDQGALRKHVTVFVDGRRVADRTDLSDPVGDESSVYVLQALSGG